MNPANETPAPGASTLALTVVLPVFNEEACIGGVLAELFTALAGGPPFEVVAVDDGSLDATPALLAAVAAREPRLRVLRLAPNAGQSAAFAAGFRAARAPLIATMDADGQNDPADIPRLVAALDAGSGADLACGIRTERHDTAARRLASRVGNAVRRLVLRDGVRDTGCSLKVFRAEWARSLPYFDGAHRFYPALCAMRGARVVQLPVAHRGRAGGRSKYTNFGRFLRTVPDLLAVRWLAARQRRFSVREVTSGCVER